MSRRSLIAHGLGIAGIFAALAGGSACVPASRVARLEAEVDALRAQLDAEEELPDYELRLQSSTVAIEKNRERLDRIVPPDAQWMSLSFGASLKWYVDAEIDAVYVQFIDVDTQEAAVTVSLSTLSRQTTHRMHPGESVEQRMTELDPPRTVVLSLHRIRVTDGGAPVGLFSVVPLEGEP